MTAPRPDVPAPRATGGVSPLLRAAIWVAIGALIAAAVVCVVWVLVGSQNGIVGRAFLTILLLAAFAGVSILDVHLAPRRPTWFTLVSMGSWVLALLIGAFLIWMPEDPYAFGSGIARFFAYFLIVLILQLGVLHVRLYTRAHQRHPMTFTAIVTYVTVALVALLVVMLVLPLMLWEWVEFHDIYWRLVVAVAILAAVGTALVPLVNALFAPRGPRAAPPVAWPTYADGVTPLPVLPDGTPDWNAYYTGYPTVVSAPLPAAGHANASVPPAPPVPAPPIDERTAPAQAHGMPAPAPAAGHVSAPPPPPQPGYQGYPPPPPLPPRS
jgi:hypothetical protein